MGSAGRGVVAVGVRAHVGGAAGGIAGAETTGRGLLDDLLRRVGCPCAAEQIADSDATDDGGGGGADDFQCPIGIAACHDETPSRLCYPLLYV